MTIHCAHCRNGITNEDDHFAKCDAWLMKEGTQMKSERITCEICGKSFNPSGFAQHVCIKQPAATMLSRKMDKLLSKKKCKGLMVDLSSHYGEVPPPQNESENLKFMLKHLNEIRLAKIPNIIARVRSVLMARRLRHKNNFWRRHYNKFGLQAN